jgi:ADP-heptose:LPS heptosyltransferase
MKDSKALRFIDRYVGMVICFLFSLVFKFKKKRELKRIKNVLLLEFFEMSASILSYPSIKLIIDSLDNPNIFYLCLDQSKPCLELLDIIPVNNIYTINGNSSLAFVASLLRQIIKLRKKNIDVIIDYELFFRVSAITSFLIKSKSKAGFYKYDLEGLYRGSFYDIKCSYNQNSHIAINFIALTKSAIEQNYHTPNLKEEIKASDIILPRYKSDVKMKKRIFRKLENLYSQYDDQNLILVCPDVGKVLPLRNYPKDYYVEVIKKLLENDPQNLVLLIGVLENMKTCSYIHSKVNHKKCINFCGYTATIKELVELIDASELYIGNDNGPAHFASLTQTNTLALFSIESPNMFGPLGKAIILYSSYHCSPCVSAFNHKSTVCRDNLCLQSLKPEKVADYAIRLMNNELTYRTVNNEIHYI